MRENDLNTVVSVVSAKYYGNMIGVLLTTKYPNVYSFEYPLKKGGKYVNCGGTGFNIDCETITARPATPEEIKEWRNADGVGKSARKTASSAEKVRNIKWVASCIRCGGTIITEFNNKNQ